MKKFIGPRLRRLRVENGQTQAQMARALGISTSYVNLLEKNERSVSVPVLSSIASQKVTPKGGKEASTSIFARKGMSWAVAALTTVLIFRCMFIARSLTYDVYVRYDIRNVCQHESEALSHEPA